MRRLTRFFRGRRIVLPALLVSQILTLMRNTLVARLLGPEQFGIAVTFLLAQQFLEMAADTGLSKYLLQSRSGNRPSVQATVQMLSAIRGVVIAILIVAVAWPVFIALGLTANFLPFALLALASASTGFLHFDTARQQRREIYANDSLSTLAGDAIGLLACGVALLFMRDYVVVLIGIFARSIGTTAVSHLLADRRYVLRLSTPIAATVFAYSWPLMINGPLLFASSQADRIFVTAALGLRELGIYSATLLLVVLPMGLLQRVLGKIFIPRLSAAYHVGNMGDVEREFTGIALTAYLLAATGFAAIGPLALEVLYGNAYAQAALPVALIGLSQAMRFLRSWPMGLALSVGQTRNLLLSNFIRLLALPLGLAGVLLGDGIAGMVIGLLAGETLALLISLILLNRGRGLSLTHGLPALGVAIAVAIILPVAFWLVAPGHLLAPVIAVIVLAGALLAVRLIDPRLIPRDFKSFGW
jgi:lipopolysaccharide exporter